MASAITTLRGKTVLVTGASGFLGGHLVASLTREGAQVHAVSRSVAAPQVGEVRWWQGDLRDLEWLQQLTVAIQPDVIYGLATSGQGGQNREAVLPTFENDLRTTINTLLAAQQCACGLVVLAASLEEPMFDGRPVVIATPYAAAKTAATFYASLFSQVFGVPVAVLRLFMSYGPGQRPQKLIPYTITSMLKGETPRLSSGVRPVDWVYVEDAISAFMRAAVVPEAVGTIIELGSGEMVSVRSVVELIHDLLPGSPNPEFSATRDRVLEQVRHAETEPALRILGWKATTPLSAGLAQTIQWYKHELTSSRAS
jgi:nucleoside-diphosphate-sugar epimerase